MLGEGIKTENQLQNTRAMHDGVECKMDDRMGDAQERGNRHRHRHRRSGGGGGLQLMVVGAGLFRQGIRVPQPLEDGAATVQ